MKHFERRLYEALGTQDYQLPAQPGQLMADFYLLSLLQGLRGPASHRTQELDYELEQAQRVLIPHLRSHLLLKAGYSILSELRHLFDCTNHPKHKSPQDKLALFRDSPLGPLLLQHEPTPELATMGNCLEAATLGLRLFNNGRSTKLRWRQLYGGAPWARACQTWLALYRARSLPDMIANVDRLYSLQHNTGALLDKNPEYTGPWVKRLLDLKFRADHPEQLLPFASPTLRRLGRMVLVNSTGRGWDGGPSDAMRAGFVADLFQEVERKLRGRCAIEYDAQLLKLVPLDAYHPTRFNRAILSAHVESGGIEVGYGGWDSERGKWGRTALLPWSEPDPAGKILRLAELVLDPV